MMVVFSMEKFVRMLGRGWRGREKREEGEIIGKVRGKVGPGTLGS